MELLGPEFVRRFRNLLVNVHPSLLPAFPGVGAIEDYAGFPEILDGGVKTLNPRVHAGLLAVRSERSHVDTLNEHEIEPIDLVCVNLYPFERVSGRRGVEEHEVVENIDIGGSTLIRAAAKKHAFAAGGGWPESHHPGLPQKLENDGKLSAR